MTKQIQKKVNVASNAVHTHAQANEWAEKVQPKHRRRPLTFGDMYLRAVCILGTLISLYLVYFFYTFNWFTLMGLMMAAVIAFTYMFKTTMRKSGENK